MRPNVSDQHKLSKMGELFCFQSKVFKRDTAKSWRGLQEEKHLCDMTLACTDGQVETHKIVLSACSPVFRNLIKRHPHNHPLIFLRGVKYKEIVYMLSFMYQGEVNIPQEELQDFLEVGQDLKLAGLTNDEATSVKNAGANIKIEPSNETEDMDEDGDGDEDEEEEEEEEEEQELDSSDQVHEERRGKSEPVEVLDHYKPQSYFNQKEGVDFFYCDKCDYESFKISDLKRHVAAKHKKERFPCDECDYKTSTKYFLKRHVKNQHGAGGAPKAAKVSIFQCEHCDYSSTRNYNLQKHMRSMHKDKVPPEVIAIEEDQAVRRSAFVDVEDSNADDSNTNLLNIGGYSTTEGYTENNIYAHTSRPSMDAGPGPSPSGLDYY